MSNYNCTDDSMPKRILPQKGTVVLMTPPEIEKREKREKRTYSKNKDRVHIKNNASDESRPFNINSMQNFESEEWQGLSRESLMNKVKDIELRGPDSRRGPTPAIHVNGEEDVDFGTGQVVSLLRHTINPYTSLDMENAEDDADAIHQLNSLKKRGRVIKPTTPGP